MKSKNSDIRKILDQVKIVRKQKGLTQENVAKVIGVERSTYVRKEAGAIPLTMGEFLSIAEFLEISYKVADGKIEVQPKVQVEMLELIRLMESLPKDDKNYILETTKGLIRYIKKSLKNQG